MAGRYESSADAADEPAARPHDEASRVAPPGRDATPRGGAARGESGRAAGRAADDEVAWDDEDAGASTQRLRPSAGETTRGAIEPAGDPGDSAVGARVRPSRARIAGAAALGLWVMAVGTCLWFYVASCMSHETANQGAQAREPAGDEAARGPEPGAMGGAAGGSAEGAGAPADADRGPEAEAPATAEDAHAGATGEASVRGEVEAQGEAATTGESLWVAVAAADREAATRRRQIAAQARALTGEPRVLACLLGHVPIGVGRRTTLRGSLVVAGGGEVVRATIREGAVPARARACVEAELQRTRFAAGSQARLKVPLRLEIQ